MRELKGHAPRSQPVEPGGGWVLMGVPFLAVATVVALFMSGVIGDRSNVEDMPVTFLAPFHEVFGFNGTLILMDLAGAVVLGQAIYLLVRYLRFGHSELELGRVPFRLGETFEASLLPAPSLAHLERVTVTLRCIQERSESRGHGKSRRLEVIGYELYFVTEELDAGALREGQPLKIGFPLPKQPGLGTCLGESPPRYWELTVESEVSGVDYHATFLVPIYARVDRSSKRKKESSRAA